VTALLREPIPVRVTRYACPSCARTASSKSRAREHIARCWLDPANRGCKTCAHFRPADSADFETGYPGFPEICDVGVDLSGHPRCSTCSGVGFYPAGMDVGGPCVDCDNDPDLRDEVKPGPIVHCPEWESSAEVNV
jgi:hypothetical protein